MLASKPITIVGGGLGGLTLGIGLRQHGVPVTIVEAGNYPRHRVCGEFIHGRGLKSLERLGLLDGIRQAGGIEAKRAAFFSNQASIPVRQIPSSALCISRFVLDAWLADEFQKLGGELLLNMRWSKAFTEGVVRASGRRVEGVSGGWRLFGLKAHVTDVTLIADLEMHFVPSGYVGMCQLANREVNVCGIFRSRTPVPDLSTRWKDWLGGRESSTLHSRLGNAVFETDSFCSIAGISLRRRRAAELGEFCLGDSLTMIPPVTGNGMSMAFESSEHAVEPLVRYSKGEVSWETARRDTADKCDRAFAGRLRWAGLIQWLLFKPSARRLLFGAARHSSKLWQYLINHTR